MELETILNTIQAGGVVGLLALAVYAGYRGLVVPRAWMDEVIPKIVSETIRQLKEKNLL